jgi:drug/metabolite transporter (DMT)-like permease
VGEKQAAERADTRLHTALGLLAIVLWSTSIGVSRSVVEKLGPLTAGAAIFTLAGVLGCLILLARSGFGDLRRLPRRYLLGCGGLFVAYELCLYLAIGLAAGGRQVLEVGVINYLWPGLTVLLAVPLLGRRAGPFLVPGVLVAFAGVVVAAAGRGGLSWAGFLDNLQANPAAYLLALGAAVTWALYSNLAKRWAGGHKGNAVPVFLLATGLLLLGLSTLFRHRMEWSGATLLEILFLAVFTSLLAYAFWDGAMRHGNMTLVAAASYATPILSMLVTSIYLHVAAGASLWIASALVAAGAVVSKLSLRPDGETPAADATSASA